MTVDTDESRLNLKTLDVAVETKKPFRSPINHVDAKTTILKPNLT